MNRHHRLIWSPALFPLAAGAGDEVLVGRYSAFQAISTPAQISSLATEATARFPRTVGEATGGQGGADRRTGAAIRPKTAPPRGKRAQLAGQSGAQGHRGTGTRGGETRRWTGAPAGGELPQAAAVPANRIAKAKNPTVRAKPQWGLSAAVARFLVRRRGGGWVALGTKGPAALARRRPGARDGEAGQLVRNGLPLASPGIQPGLRLRPLAQGLQPPLGHQRVGDVGGQPRADRALGGHPDRRARRAGASRRLGSEASPC